MTTITPKQVEARHEQWRDIVGYEGLYMVSDIGRIKHCGVSWTLKTHVNRHGYLTASLRKPHKAAKTFMVHRLVAQAFLGPAPSIDRNVVNHLNGIRDDNRAENLEWCSQAENIKHSVDVLGTGIPNFAKLTDAKVREIRVLSRQGVSNINLSEQFGVTETCVDRIIKRKTWRHIE